MPIVCISTPYRGIQYPIRLVLHHIDHQKPTMNPLEAQLTYPFDDALPPIGGTHEIVPGLFWLRMPLPFALNHINLWLLEDSRENCENPATERQAGWCAVDCGIASDETRAAWEAVFATHCNDAPLLRVLATHCHPDHVGLSGWLCSRWNAPLWMSTGEYGFARMMSANLPGVEGLAALPHFQKHGLADPALIEQMRTRKNYYTSLVPSVPDAYTRIQDRQELVIGKHRWRAITGFGHAPEHVSLYCPQLDVLISGDMVLPRISTNVSVFAVEPEANPLQLYLDSLEKFSDLPTSTLVLPSHGRPFRGLHIRIAQLREHHTARLAEVMDACSNKPCSAADIVPIMFKRQLDAHQLNFAIGEALAHCHKLWYDGLLQRQIGGDNVIRFTKFIKKKCYNKVLAKSPNN
jgi:glyoxylase-like metal-dependent hydrolase (beta-lactamase superfamily II)